MKNIFMTVERINNKALLERVQKTHEIALKAAHSLIEEDVESQKRGDALALALFLHVPPVYLDLVLRGAHIAREEVVARAIRRVTYLEKGSCVEFYVTSLESAVKATAFGKRIKDTVPIDDFSAVPPPELAYVFRDSPEEFNDAISIGKEAAIHEMLDLVQRDDSPLLPRPTISMVEKRFLLRPEAGGGKTAEVLTAIEGVKLCYFYPRGSEEPNLSLRVSQ